MEQSPSGEPNRFSASKEITRILMNPKVYYRVNESPPYIVCPYPEPDQSSPFPHPISLRPILVLSSHVLLPILQLK